MSNYPDPNYATTPTYPSNTGTDCSNPKPYWFYDGATFCNDVTIGNNLVTNSFAVTSPTITVGDTEYQGVLFLNNYDGFYYTVLASLASTPT
jgi:hypothetical protein